MNEMIFFSSSIMFTHDQIETCEEEKKYNMQTKFYGPTKNSLCSINNLSTEKCANINKYGSRMAHTRIYDTLFFNCADNNADRLNNRRGGLIF